MPPDAATPPSTDAPAYLRGLAAAEPRALWTAQLCLGGVAMKKSGVAVALTTYHHPFDPQWLADDAAGTPAESLAQANTLFATVLPDDMPALCRALADAAMSNDTPNETRHGEPPLLAAVVSLRESSLGDGQAVVLLGQSPARALLTAFGSALQAREPAHTVVEVLRTSLALEPA